MRDALDPLVGQELKLFPQVAGWGNYRAADRPDIQHALKCVLADVHSPCVLSMARLKRTGRYLAGRPVLEWLYPLQELPKGAVYQTDSDWGEDKVARKSTTSCCGYFG